mgnify:CR=1 FL=1
MKKIGFIIMCLLLYACNPETPTEARKTNTRITDYTVTEFANHRICIIEYRGHEYMCVGTGGIVALESCKCHEQ